MKTDDGHLGSDALNELIQQGRDPEDVVRDTPHLRDCPECRRMFVQLSRIDRALHRLPLPHVGREFTAGVMARIPRGVAQRYGFRLFVGGASVFVALVGAAFVIAGYLVVSRLLGDESAHQGATAIEQGVSSVGVAVQWCTEKLNEYLKGALGARTLRILMPAIGGALLLFLVDRIFGRTFRRRMGLER